MSDLDFTEELKAAAEKSQDETVSNLDATGHGVRTGLMRFELGNRANASASETEATVSIPGPIVERFVAFTEGRPGQPARPIHRLSPELLASLANSIAKSGRDQLVRRAQQRGSTQ